jgi:hypothetical protein
MNSAATPQSSWDEKALEIAKAIVNSREPNHSRYLAKAQLAVLDAMRWASSAAGVGVPSPKASDEAQHD